MISYRERALSFRSLNEDADLFRETEGSPDDFEIVDSLDEGRFRRAPRRTTTHRTTSSQRRKWRLMKRRPKAKNLSRKLRRKPASKRRSKILRAWRSRRHIPKRAVGRGGRIRGSLMAGIDQVANLMESANQIVQGIDQTEQLQMVESYAQLALASEQLSEDFCDYLEAFAEIVESEQIELGPEDREMLETVAALVQDYTEIAEDAASSAERLMEYVNGGVFAESVDQTILAEDFGELLELVTEGVDILSSLVEEDEDADDEDGAKKKG